MDQPRSWARSARCVIIFSGMTGTLSPVDRPGRGPAWLPAPRIWIPLALAAFLATGCDMLSGTSRPARLHYVITVAPDPSQGAMVVVRHPKLRLGEESVGIAAGVFRYATLTDAETYEPVVNVFLRGRIPPGQLRLRQADWEAWRPLAILEPRG